ncbi:MAG: HNH endonuclease signature motif containing protein [Bacteroidota bacterium]
MSYKRYHLLPEQKRLPVQQSKTAIHTIEGQRYSSLIIGEVWEKGKKEFGFYFFKRDHFGKIIAKHEYGKKTQYGWEIIYIIPPSDGGTDEVENLIPVHWEHAQTEG